MNLKFLVIIFWFALNSLAAADQTVKTLVNSTKGTKVATDIWDAEHFDSAPLLKARKAKFKDSYELIDEFYQPWSGRRFNYVLRVFERTKNKAECLETYLDLELTEISGKVALSGKESILGTNCCEGVVCQNRSPVGWMMEFFRRQSSDSSAKLLELFNPKFGFKANGKLMSKSEIISSEHHLSFLVPASFSMHRDRFECSAEFDVNGEAKCSKHAGGEGYSYKWKKDGSSAYLVEFTTDYEE